MRSGIIFQMNREGDLSLELLVMSKHLISLGHHYAKNLYLIRNKVGGMR